MIGDHNFLSQPAVNTSTNLAQLGSRATHWKEIEHPEIGLVDYGDLSNTLEGVIIYVHMVPSLNVTNVWMMNQHDYILSATNATGNSTIYFTIADTLTQKILSLHAGPNTGYWLRALSISDIVANVSVRPDHGSNGAYTSWPALTARISQLGDHDAMIIYSRSFTSIPGESTWAQYSHLIDCLDPHAAFTAKTAAHRHKRCLILTGIALVVKWNGYCGVGNKRNDYFTRLGEEL